jgi:hypothetical protein
MTAADLIELLKRVPPETLVLRGGAFGYFSYERAPETKLVEKGNTPGHYWGAVRKTKRAQRALVI